VLFALFGVLLLVDTLLLSPRHAPRYGTVARHAVRNPRPPRVEDPHLLVGDAAFVADLDLPGVLAVGYVTSTVAHGRIVAVDVSEARWRSGDRRRGHRRRPRPGPAAAPVPDVPEAMVRPLLAADRVRFVGEPIVAIVGESAATVADAAERVVVEIEPLPAVVDPTEALGNEVAAVPRGGHQPGRHGDGWRRVRAALRRVRGRGRGHLPQPAGRSVSDRDPCRGGRVDRRRPARLPRSLPGRTSHPGPARLGVRDRPSEIRVVTRDVGGSFGAKARAYPEELLLPLLARRSGRPVRFVPDRSDDMVGLGHSRAQRQRVRIGGDRDGTIRCLEATSWATPGPIP
jgi:aerobic carbon-monoxide dehydrogenase large subunit